MTLLSSSTFVNILISVLSPQPLHTNELVLHFYWSFIFLLCNLYNEGESEAVGCLINASK